MSAAFDLESDKERDIRARDSWLSEYEQYGELGEYVRMAEEKLLDFAYDEYSTSRSQMEPLLSKWAHYTNRFLGEWQDADDDTPFADMNHPKIARMIDIHVARVLQTIIPDRSRLDFFAFGSETDYEGQPPDPLTEKYGAAAANAIRNDLITGRFVEEIKKALWEFFALGNCVMMPTWDLSIQYRYRRVPNPALEEPDVFFTPDGLAYKFELVDGVQTPTLVEKEITVREPYREFDAPRLRTVNIRNVFPSELDKDNLEDCTAVCIYDTVRLADLLENEIKTGGYLYANLDRVQFADEEVDVPEVADRDIFYRDTESWTNVQSARKLDRITRIGRFRIEELFNDIAVPEEARTGVIDILAEKYGWDKTKVKGWNTWVIEMLSCGSVVGRWQPSPYMVDKKNIVHAGLFRVPNRTWAKGIYDRCVNTEIVGNAMERYRMELTLRMVRPQVFIDRTAVDNDWRQVHGDNYDFTPNGIVWLKQGKRANEAVQYPNIPTAPLQYADIAQSQQALDMSEMGHLPPVKMGSASGGATASEVQSMGSSADIILQEICLDVQDMLLNPALSWMLLLHHQYTQEPRMGYEIDPAGKAIMNMVPPEVWTHQYKVNLLGFQQVGNLAIRTMNFNEYAKFLQGAGRANMDTLAVAYGKLLGIQNAGEMIAPQQEPPPPLQDKTTANFTVRQELNPPSVNAKLMEKIGVEITPDDLVSMGDIYEAQKRAATYESTKENNMAQSEAERRLAALNSAGGEGGSPAGVPEAQPSNYMPGSHHQMNEQEQRQRGVHDDVGAVNRMGQKLRNPANGRRANG